MRQLAAHYQEIRNRYLEDRLLLLFDIDGAILDMRCIILHLLQSYDRLYGANFCQALTLSDIIVSENHIQPLPGSFPEGGLTDASLDYL